MVARNLASHLHYHRQSALRPYICQQCSATFTHASRFIFVFFPILPIVIQVTQVLQPEAPRFASWWGEAVLLHNLQQGFLSEGNFLLVEASWKLMVVLVSQVAWMTHMKSHTSDRLPCPACSKPFLTRYLLNQV